VSAARLVRYLSIYALGLVAACTGLYAVLHLDRAPAGGPRAFVVSVWRDGQRVARQVVQKDPDHVLEREATEGKAFRVVEEVLDEGPLLFRSPFLFGVSFVPSRDGVRGSYGGRDVYLTPDDLLKQGGYDASTIINNQVVKFGVDAELVYATLARELRISKAELLANATLRRVAIRRQADEDKPLRVNVQSLRAAVIGAGRYLARAVEPNGRYRYELNGATGEASPDYNWPRHAGATWYLAEAAAYSDDSGMRRAVRAAANHMVEHALMKCGQHSCVGQGERADLGSSALGLLALSELVHSGIADEHREVVASLAAFIRSQQRADGEFMHYYDVANSQPIDKQVMYYTGEAAFALGKAHHITKDPRDLESARRALASLIQKPFWFIGWRYYWPAEHWTCHALEELWDRAPNHEALQFCLDWQETVRDTAVQGREAAPEYDGASASGPFAPPQIVASATRMEAAVATLAVAHKMQRSLPSGTVQALEDGIRSTMGFMLRQQLLPGPKHLLFDSAVMRGGVPTSETDLRVRIDYPQHAGTAWIAYLRYLEVRH